MLSKVIGALFIPFSRTVDVEWIRILVRRRNEVSSCGKCPRGHLLTRKVKKGICRRGILQPEK